MPVTAKKPLPARQEAGDGVTDRDIPQQYFDGYARILTDASVPADASPATRSLPQRALEERIAEGRPWLARPGQRVPGTAHTAWADTPGSDDRTLAAVAGRRRPHRRSQSAQRLAVRQEEAARPEFIDELLYSRSDLGRLAERAERYGLRLSHAHAVAVAQGPTTSAEGDPTPVRCNGR